MAKLIINSSGKSEKVITSVSEVREMLKEYAKKQLGANFENIIKKQMEDEKNVKV